jgi:hypothetical protein
MELLHQASLALSATLDLEQVVVVALGEIRHLLGPVACSIWLSDTQNDLPQAPSGKLVRRVATDDHPEIMCRKTAD